MMDRRGFLARAGAAVVALLAGLGLPLPAWARVPPVLAPSLDPWEWDWAELDAAIDALPTVSATWPLPDTAPYDPMLRYTLRSWRAMTHPLTATAEERCLAKLPWTGSLDTPRGDGFLFDWEAL